jgi:hypothetical protein
MNGFRALAFSVFVTVVIGMLTWYVISALVGPLFHTLFPG